MAKRGADGRFLPKNAVQLQAQQFMDIAAGRKTTDSGKRRMMDRAVGPRVDLSDFDSMMTEAAGGSSSGAGGFKAMVTPSGEVHLVKKKKKKSAKAERIADLMDVAGADPVLQAIVRESVQKKKQGVAAAAVAKRKATIAARVAAGLPPVSRKKKKAAVVIANLLDSPNPSVAASALAAAKADPVVTQMVAEVLAQPAAAKKKGRRVFRDYEYAKLDNKFYYPPGHFSSNVAEDDLSSRLAGYNNPGIRRATLRSRGPESDVGNRSVRKADVFAIRKRMRTMAHMYSDLSSRKEGMKIPSTKSVRERNLFEMRDLMDRLLETGGYTKVNRKYYALGQQYVEALAGAEEGARVRLDAITQVPALTFMEGHDQLDIARFQGKVPWQSSPYAGLPGGFRFHPRLGDGKVRGARYASYGPRGGVKLVGRRNNKRTYEKI